MDNIPTKMKVCTPLGDEHFSIQRNADSIILEITKGSVDLNIIEESDDMLIAEGVLTVPFDCILSIKLTRNSDIGSFVYLTDPLLKKVFLSQECVEV